MTTAEILAAELKQEAVSTRKVLERIPETEFSWKPHEKSFTMGRLASHTAEIPNWAVMTLAEDVLDFDPEQFKPWVAGSNAELLAKFDEVLVQAIAALSGKSDTDLQRIWTMKMKGETRFSMPKAVVLRSWVLNHLVHHRGQLSVYLRLRDIPVPAIYGPSADEPIF